MKIKLIEGGKVPEYKTSGAACADCYARLPNGSIEIVTGKNALIPLGFAIELPPGYEAEIRPRSGLANDERIAIQGTIDSDYRGEVRVNIINLSYDDFKVKDGDRICQMKIQEAKQFPFEVVDELSETARGTGGFGSTGMN